MLKKLGLFVASLLSGVSLYAAVAAGPAGSFINNQNTLQQGATFYVSSGTVSNLQTTTLKFNDGTTMTTAASGTGGGGGASSFGIFKNGVQISSPSAQINFSGNYWDITLGGTSTGTVKLIGGNTNYIQVSNTLQSGATAYPNVLNTNIATIISSITVLGANGASVTYGVTAGSVTVNNLTASQFVKTDANKRLSSQAQISLATDVTGTLSASNFVSTAAYVTSTQTFSGQNTFSSMTVNKEINISSGSAETKLTSLWQSGSNFNGYLKTNGKLFAGKDNGASNIDGIGINGSARNISMGYLNKDGTTLTGTNFYNDIANNYILVRTTSPIPYVDSLGYTAFDTPGVFNILGSYDANPNKSLLQVGYEGTSEELTSYVNIFRISYSSVSTSLPVHAGSFYGDGSNLTNIVNVSSLSATGVTAGSYTNTNLTVDAQGRITAASNGSAGGGGGIASMRVEDGGSFIVDTSTFDFTGAQFVVTNSGGDGLIALNTSSVTLYGPNIPAASISAGNLGSNVLVSSVSISAFYNQAQIRTNLGLAIGTNVQAYDADLDDLADGSLTGSKVGSGVPAANIASGSLGALVMASSFTSTGVTAGSYLNANITVDATGRITAATTGVSSATAIEFIIDGSGTEIADGIKGDLEIPFACTLDRVTAIANESGSITVDIWKDTYANFPPTVADTITASAKPTITSTTKAQDTTLTGWTKSIAAGDILRFNVDAATTTTRVTISLKAFKQ